jgi:4-hydroxy-3-methylbut-2-en-1-yl diphosphate synthase IspG/GcpE
MDVAVIGCVVNGPGEAKEAHIGLTGGYAEPDLPTASRAETD